LLRLFNQPRLTVFRHNCKVVLFKLQMRQFHDSHYYRRNSCSFWST